MKSNDEKNIFGVFQDCVRWHGILAELQADNAFIHEGPFIPEICP